jgi:hypothetical protein
MAFGQASGPPATAKQVQELLSLLQGAGHSDFRDARGPMGFTQRQAGGKFTRDEADEFIEALQTAAEAGDAGDGAGGGGGAGDADARRAARAQAGRRAAAPATARAPQGVGAADRALRRLPAEQLAAELQRRGWVVMEP